VSNSSVKEIVRQFVIENFYVPEPSDLGDGTSLIETGFVDSTGMLEIIAFLEEQYRIAIEDTETTPENLETIGRIADFIARKQAPGRNGT
jgi:acyl carrier protein